MNLSQSPSSGLEKAFDKLFEDHEDLSDYIMARGGIEMNLKQLRKLARAGKIHANDHTTNWLRRMVSAIKSEVEELAESIPWKWWRNESTDIHNVRVELIDIFHFLLSASAVSGMTGADFIRVYYQKRYLNYERQNVGFIEGDNEKHQIGKIDLHGSPDIVE